MRIVMLSEDGSILQQGSEARARMREYARMMEELHIVVASERSGRPLSEGNLFLYPASVHDPVGRKVAAAFIVRSLSKQLLPDVITLQSPDETGLLVWLLTRRLRIPFQIQLHTDMFSPWYRKASWKERLRYRIAKFLIPRAACVRVASERIKQSLISSRVITDASRIFVLPIYTDLRKFIYAQPAAAAAEPFSGYSFKIFAAGRFVDKEKNFSMLIDVMKRFIDTCPDAVLVLAGDGPDAEVYRKKIEKKNLTQHVIIEPWSEDMASYYAACDVYAVSSRFEGWGRSVIEAMASGTCVLMTDVGVAGEVVKDGLNGRVVRVNDKEAFLRALEDLYRNPHARKTLAQAAQRTVSAMHPQTQDEYLEMYKRSLATCLIK